MRWLFLLALLIPNAALADGRADWSGYDWKSVPIKACPDLGASGSCAIHDAKWDWKRPQWVRLWLSRQGRSLRVEAQLDNRDRADDDFVCIVVLLQDAGESNQGVVFFNVHSDPRTLSTFERSVPFDIDRLQRIARIAVGTKQCRKGAEEDLALFEQVKAAIR